MKYFFLSVFLFLAVSIDWPHISGPTQGWECDDKECIGQWYIEVPFKLAPKEYKPREKK